MKYALAALAAVAAVAALCFRPPQREADAPLQPQPVPYGAGTRQRPSASRGGTIVVYVAGAVNKPGLYTLPFGRRAHDALERAGGAASGADLVAVNLAAPLHDGDEVAVPLVNDRPRARRAVPRARKRHPRSARHPKRTDGAPVAFESLDLNAATPEDLSALPGIGAGLAARIVAYREENGPFAQVDELADVAGITPRLLDDVAPLLHVNPGR